MATIQHELINCGRLAGYERSDPPVLVRDPLLSPMELSE
jgi:hypothetical protein